MTHYKHTQNDLEWVEGVDIFIGLSQSLSPFVLYRCQWYENYRTFTLLSFFFLLFLLFLSLSISVFLARKDGKCPWICPPSSLLQTLSISRPPEISHFHFEGPHSFLAVPLCVLTFWRVIIQERLTLPFSTSGERSSFSILSDFINRFSHWLNRYEQTNILRHLLSISLLCPIRANIVVAATTWQNSLCRNFVCALRYFINLSFSLLIFLFVGCENARISWDFCNEFLSFTCRRSCELYTQSREFASFFIPVGHYSIPQSLAHFLHLFILIAVYREFFIEELTEIQRKSEKQVQTDEKRTLWFIPYPILDYFFFET